MHPLIVSLEQIQYQRYETLQKTNNKEKLKCWGSHNTYWYKWSKQRLYTKRDCNQSYGSCCWCKEKSSQEVANYNKALNVNRELTELCASIIYIKHGNIHPWNHLTLSWRRQLSYRNQSIDLRSKSMDWFYMITASVMKKVKYIFGLFHQILYFICVNSYNKYFVDDLYIFFWRGKANPLFGSSRFFRWGSLGIFRWLGLVSHVLTHR